MQIHIHALESDSDLTQFFGVSKSGRENILLSLARARVREKRIDTKCKDIKSLKMIYIYVDFFESQTSKACINNIDWWWCNRVKIKFSIPIIY